MQQRQVTEANKLLSEITKVTILSFAIFSEFLLNLKIELVYLVISCIYILVNALGYILQLKQHLQFAKDKHKAEVDGMKREIQQLTTDLHDRDNTVASITERASNMERTLRDQSELLDRKSTELEVIYF